MSELKPCPYCKSATRINTVKKRIGKATPSMFEVSQIKCKRNSCGMSGPLVKGENSRLRAAKAWNTPTLSAAMELPEVKAMKEALELARNRLQRLAIEFPTESGWQYEVNEWVEEATTALAAIKEPKP